MKRQPQRGSEGREKVVCDNQQLKKQKRGQLLGKHPAKGKKSNSIPSNSNRFIGRSLTYDSSSLVVVDDVGGTTVDVVDYVFPATRSQQLSQVVGAPSGGSGLSVASSNMSVTNLLKSAEVQKMEKAFKRFSLRSSAFAVIMLVRLNNAIVRKRQWMRTTGGGRSGGSTSTGLRSRSSSIFAMSTTSVAQDAAAAITTSTSKKRSAGTSLVANLDTKKGEDNNDNSSFVLLHRRGESASDGSLPQQQQQGDDSLEHMATLETFLDEIEKGCSSSPDRHGGGLGEDDIDDDVELLEEGNSGDEQDDDEEGAIKDGGGGGRSVVGRMMGRGDGGDDDITSGQDSSFVFSVLDPSGPSPARRRKRKKKKQAAPHTTVDIRMQERLMLSLFSQPTTRSAILQSQGSSSTTGSLSAEVNEHGHPHAQEGGELRKRTSKTGKKEMLTEQQQLLSSQEDFSPHASSSFDSTTSILINHALNAAQRRIAHGLWILRLRKKIQYHASRKHQTVFEKIPPGVWTNSVLFAGWPKPALQEALTGSYVEQLSRGEVLYYRGEEERNIYIVLDGKCQQFRRLDEEDKRVNADVNSSVSMFFPGPCCIRDSTVIIEEENNKECVVAMSLSTVVVLRKASVEAAFNNIPSPCKEQVSQRCLQIRENRTASLPASFRESILLKTSLFQHLSREQLRTIGSLLLPVSYLQDTVIVRKDQPTQHDRIFFVVKGEVKGSMQFRSNNPRGSNDHQNSSSSGDWEEVAFAKWGEGEYLGEKTVYFNDRHFYNIIAARHCDLLCISRADLTRVLQDDATGLQDAVVKGALSIRCRDPAVKLLLHTVRNIPCVLRAVRDKIISDAHIRELHKSFEFRIFPVASIITSASDVVKEIVVLATGTAVGDAVGPKPYLLPKGVAFGGSGVNPVRWSIATIAATSCEGWTISIAKLRSIMESWGVPWSRIRMYGREEAGKVLTSRRGITFTDFVTVDPPRPSGPPLKPRKAQKKFRFSNDDDVYDSEKTTAEMEERGNMGEERASSFQPTQKQLELQHPLGDSSTRFLRSGRTQSLASATLSSSGAVVGGGGGGGAVAASAASPSSPTASPKRQSYLPCSGGGGGGGSSSSRQITISIAAAPAVHHHLHQRPSSSSLLAATGESSSSVGTTEDNQEQHPLATASSMTMPTTTGMIMTAMSLDEDSVILGGGGRKRKQQHSTAVVTPKPFKLRAAQRQAHLRPTVLKYLHRKLENTTHELLDWENEHCQHLSNIKTHNRSGSKNNTTEAGEEEDIVAPAAAAASEQFRKEGLLPPRPYTSLAGRLRPQQRPTTGGGDGRRTHDGHMWTAQRQVGSRPGTTTAGQREAAGIRHRSGQPQQLLHRHPSQHGRQLQSDHRPSSALLASKGGRIGISPALQVGSLRQRLYNTFL